MSNTWFYRILITSQPALEGGQLRRIIELAKTHGYSVINPYTNKISIYRTNIETLDFEELEFNDLDEAKSEFNKLGTLLLLWNNEEIDISLGIDPAGAGEKWAADRYQGKDEPSFGEISILVGGHFLKVDSQEKMEVSESVKAIFYELCQEFNSPYAYSLDEEALEKLFIHMEVHKNVSFQEKPSVLFWLNYFSKDYLTKIGGPEIFEKIGGKVDLTPAGAFISFFQYPWDVDWNQLHVINENWRKIKAID